MKYTIMRNKGDHVAFQEMAALLLHLSVWDIELIDIIVQPDIFIIVLSDYIPKDQEAHLNTEEQKVI